MTEESSQGPFSTIFPMEKENSSMPTKMSSKDSSRKAEEKEEEFTILAKALSSREFGTTTKK